MMEASPSTPFIVAKPDLLLEFLIIALDPPAHHGAIDQPTEADVRRQRRKPVFDRSRLARGPFDEQPLLRQQFRDRLIIADPYAHACEARRQPIGRARSPSDRAPSPLRQAQRKLLGRD